MIFQKFILRVTMKIGIETMNYIINWSFDTKIQFKSENHKSSQNDEVNIN